MSHRSYVSGDHLPCPTNSWYTSADRVVVLENGEIIEQGRHTTLLQNGGYYADIYDRYFRYQALDHPDVDLGGRDAR